MWVLDSLNSEDCASAQTKLNGVSTVITSCYFDRNDQQCPPQSFKNVVEFAKKNNLALIAGIDANAHNTMWHSRITDRVGETRGDSLLEYLVEQNLILENVGDKPTFDNGRWQNCIDLTITNSKGHDLVNHWSVVIKGPDENSSDHSFITYQTKYDTLNTKRSFRDISKTNWEVYEAKLEAAMEGSAELFGNISNETDLDKAADTLATNVLESFNSATELTFVSSTAKPPPWDTAEVREARKDMRSKLRTVQKPNLPNPEAIKANYRASRDSYEKLKKRTITARFKDFCQKLESQSDSKRISSLIKDNKTIRLSTVRDSEGRLTESPQETLNVLANTHFKENPDQGDRRKPVVLGPNETSSPCGPEGGRPWDLDHIFSENRLRKALEEFNPMTAAGPDGVKPIMLQKGWHYIKAAYASIAKASFRLGYTPESWRNSTGIFLPKPGKADYYNPKSYRTITLAPVPLKWMERVVLWHMEVDLDIYSKLSKKQYGFRRGCSTIAAVHKLVRKIEHAILNQGMALGTFLDIEGAFDNVSFEAINRALNSKCESPEVNRWIMSMIHNRKIEVGLHGEMKVVAIRRGCPQGGILSPFLWNLVVDDLLTYKRDRIPCDNQGFADDMALVAVVLAPKPVGGRQGFDADTLREVTQKSLLAINEWCKDSGLKLSMLKTHSVMFTKRRNWSFSRPLMVEGTEIEVKNSTKFLGLILDSKLSWNDHIEYLCKKSKGILMQCRKAVGPTWGFKPQTMRWIYNAIVKPTMSYGATIWINGTKTKKNQDLLNRVQRLGNILITGALPSTPGTALNVITNTIPIISWLEEEAVKGALRLKNLGHWQPAPVGKPSKSFHSHIKTLESMMEDIPSCQAPQDQTVPILNIGQEFTVVIPSREEYSESQIGEWSDITCYTDGSMMNGSVGAAVIIQTKDDSIDDLVDYKHSYHLGDNSTVFQSEVFAVGQTANTLCDMKVTDKNITINCDSQAALRALSATIVKSHTVLNAIHALNSLAKFNRVNLTWIPAHSEFDGNEIADKYAKMGSNNTNSTSVLLPVPRCVCYAALRRKTIARWDGSLKTDLPQHFSVMWRDKFKKELSRMGKRDLRAATQILTGHSTLNYHLNKLVRNIEPLCPLCKASDETVTHLLGQCPLRWYERVEFFDQHITNSSDIVDRYSLTHILRYVRLTGRLTEDR